MISSGNATIYVSNLDASIRFYAEQLGLSLTNRIGDRWATIDAGPSYWTSQGIAAGLTLGLRPASGVNPPPVTLGLIVDEPIATVISRLSERGVRVPTQSEPRGPVDIEDLDGNVITLWEADAAGRTSLSSTRRPSRTPDPHAAALRMSAAGPDSCFSHWLADARIVHEPDTLPARNVPLIAVSTAFANISANSAFGLRSTLAVHAPEYSPCFPSTKARHAPVQPDAALTADQVPRMTVRPLASISVHPPVTAPVFASSVAVHVPPSASPVLLRAAQVLTPVPPRLPWVCPLASAA
jgi:catechol 2,3-dioxygenase-like lactoylglutathione lyase family enzyme